LNVVLNYSNSHKPCQRIVGPKPAAFANFVRLHKKWKTIGKIIVKMTTKNTGRQTARVHGYVGLSVLFHGKKHFCHLGSRHAALWLQLSVNAVNHAPLYHGGQCGPGPLGNPFRVGEGFQHV